MLDLRRVLSPPTCFATFILSRIAATSGHRAVGYFVNHVPSKQHVAPMPIGTVTLNARITKVHKIGHLFESSRRRIYISISLFVLLQICRHFRRGSKGGWGRSPSPHEFKNIIRLSLTSLILSYILVLDPRLIPPY